MKQGLKKLLDYLPLLVTIVYNLSNWFPYKAGIILQWETYFGFTLLALTIAGFVIKHQFGILSTGLLLLFGFVGLISLSPAVFSGAGFTINSLSVPFGDYVYLLLFIFHFIISARYYTGIVTKKYWQELTNKKLDHV